MPFVDMPGLPGKLYVPASDRRRPRKHPCRDCFTCQMCSDARCEACRGKETETTGGGKGHRTAKGPGMLPTARCGNSA